MKSGRESRGKGEENTRMKEGEGKDVAEWKRGTRGEQENIGKRKRDRREGKEIRRRARSRRQNGGRFVLGVR